MNKKDGMTFEERFKYAKQGKYVILDSVSPINPGEEHEK